MILDLCFNFFRVSSSILNLLCIYSYWKQESLLIFVTIKKRNNTAFHK